jgi:GTPase SAR1 family protein
MKKLSVLASVGLTLLASSFLTNPVKANVVSEAKSESLEQINVDSSQILISQDLGHDEYDGSPQMEWNNYQLGKVVGIAGNIKFILLPDGTYFSAAGAGYPGGNVLVEEIDEEYRIVDVSHAAWITHLEADYGWRRVTRIQPPLLERTAPIWAQLDSMR